MSFHLINANKTQNEYNSSADRKFSFEVLSSNSWANSVNVYVNGSIVEGGPFQISKSIYDSIVKIDDPIQYEIDNEIGELVDVESELPFELTNVDGKKDKYHNTDTRQFSFNRIEENNGTSLVDVFLNGQKIEQGPFQINSNELKNITDPVYSTVSNIGANLNGVKRFGAPINSCGKRSFVTIEPLSDNDDQGVVSGKVQKEIFCILKKQFGKKIPKSSISILSDVHETLERQLEELNVNGISYMDNKNARSHFYAQILLETDFMKTTVEYGSIDYFNGKTYKHKYRGRGLIQLTGCSNMFNYLIYESINRAGLEKEIPIKNFVNDSHFNGGNSYLHCTDDKIKKIMKTLEKEYPNIPLDKDPKVEEILLSSPASLDRLATDQNFKIGGLSHDDMVTGTLMYYWKHKVNNDEDAAKHLNLTDNKSIDSISRMVNGGSNGKLERRSLFKKAQSCIKD